MLHGHRHEQGVRPPWVPLAGGGNRHFGAAPGSWEGVGAGVVLAGGYGQGCSTVVTLTLQSQQSSGVEGPGPEEIACQGLRRAAATRSISIQRHHYGAKGKATLVNMRRGDKST